MNIQDLFNLDKKTAFISGGATGIGRMAAEAMAMAGARVLIASRKGPACASVAEEINQKGYKGIIESFEGDLSSETGIEALVKEIKIRTGKLNILMNITLI